jgi:hypothetical protein
MEDKFVLIATCQRIIAVTQVLCRNILQTKLLVIHKPDEWSSKNKLCIVATTSLLAVVTTASYKKWVQVVFSQGVN